MGIRSYNEVADIEGNFSSYMRLRINEPTGALTPHYDLGDCRYRDIPGHLRSTLSELVGGPGRFGLVFVVRNNCARMTRATNVSAFQNVRCCAGKSLVPYYSSI